MNDTLATGFQQRRLAAIMATDVVGYSRMMSQDEVGTLQALKAHQVSDLTPAVAAHSGRIVKYMGSWEEVHSGMRKSPRSREATTLSRLICPGLARTTTWRRFGQFARVPNG